MRLSAAEKDSLWRSIDEYIQRQPPATLPSYRFLTHPLRYSLAGILAAMVLTVSAAETALPGDLLYPIKVEVSEPLVSTLAPTNKTKAAIHSVLAERRLKEAEEVLTDEDITPIEKEEAIADLANRLTAHIVAAHEKLDEITNQNAEATAEAVEIASNLEISLRSHEYMLTTIASTSLPLASTTSQLIDTVAVAASTTDQIQDELSNILSEEASSTATSLINERADEAEAEIDSAIKEAAADPNRPDKTARELKIIEARQFLEQARREASSNTSAANDLIDKSITSIKRLESTISDEF